MLRSFPSSTFTNNSVDASTTATTEPILSKYRLSEKMLARIRFSLDFVSFFKK